MENPTHLRVPGQDPQIAPHTGIGNRLEVADQIKIGCSGEAMGRPLVACKSDKT